MVKIPSRLETQEFIKHYIRGEDAMIIMITNARLTFPDIWKPTAFEQGQELKYKAGFLVPKANTKLMKDIEAGILHVAREAWKDKAAAELKNIRNVPNKFFLLDGDSKSYDGYADAWCINASNKKRPTIKDRDNSPLTEADGRPYAGCYVNASVEIWAQDNKWGKAIRASLRGIQFVKDGDAFTAGTVAKDDEFEDLGAGAHDEDEEELG